MPETLKIRPRKCGGGQEGGEEVEGLQVLHSQWAPHVKGSSDRAKAGTERQKPKVDKDRVDDTKYGETPVGAVWITVEYGTVAIFRQRVREEGREIDRKQNAKACEISKLVGKHRIRATLARHIVNFRLRNLSEYFTRTF